MKKHVFDPLDMNDTGFRIPRENIGRFADMYVSTQGRGDNAFMNVSDQMGSGKIYITTLNGYLIICSANSGEMISFKKIGNLITTSPIISNGSLYILCINPLQPGKLQSNLFFPNVRL